MLAFPHADGALALLEEAIVGLGMKGLEDPPGKRHGERATTSRSLLVKKAVEFDARSFFHSGDERPACRSSSRSWRERVPGDDDPGPYGRG